MPPSGRRATPTRPICARNRFGFGRELFAMMRAQVGTAEQGGSALFVDEDEERAMSDALALVADIGGTNARFALTDLDAPTPALREIAGRCRTRTSPACSMRSSITSHRSASQPNARRARGRLPGRTPTRSA